MTEASKTKNRRIRQDALREWLSEKCTAQHLIDNLEKIEKLDPADETFANSLNKYKVANDQRLKILNKYLPDLRQTEISGDPDNPIKHDHVVEFVGIDADRDS